MKFFAALLLLCTTTPLLAQQGIGDGIQTTHEYAQEDGWLAPFDYDFGGYTWSAAGNASLSATPYTLSGSNNRYDNYIFETRPVGSHPYASRFIFRYEYKNLILKSDGSGVVDNLHINDVLFFYRSLGQPVYIDLGWGMRALNASSNTEMSGNWYFASGLKFTDKLGLHYQQLNAVNKASNSREQTIYLDYMVGYKSYLMLGYKRQRLSWAGGSNTLNLDGFMAGVYFKF